MILHSRISFIFLISAIILSTHVDYFSQKERIVKIIDANLFELRSGKLIKLAGVDVPNINHPDPNLRNVAFDAYMYAKNSLLIRKFDVKYPAYSSIDTNYFLINLIREYPLLTRDYTEEYLRKGFGKYIPNTEGIDSSKYLTAQLEAKEDQNGIWKFYTESKQTLDQNYSEIINMDDNWIDSVENSITSNPYFKNISNSSRVLLEIVSAPVVGTISAIMGGAVLIGVSGKQGWDSFGYAIIGGYISYTIGSAAGVYFIAKNGNREVDFATTLVYSSLGALSSIAILRLIQNEGGTDGPLVYSPLILPGLAAIIYSNIIAPKKSKENISYKTLSRNIFIKEMNTHKDYYNSSKLFDLELARISF